MKTGHLMPAGKKQGRKRRLLFVFGTRPEAIKMAPLILRLGRSCKTTVCSTGQHREMAGQVLSFFSIRPDFDLGVMTPNQGLSDLTASCLRGLDQVIDRSSPDLVLVQGDTTTAFAGALAAFYRKVPVAHIEAGLRSFDKHSPYPEEMNRLLAGRLSDIHFAPTAKAKQNLLKEGFPARSVSVTGNTVIDALLAGLEIVRKDEARYAKNFRFLDMKRKIVLVTAHRRESFGRPLENIFRALREIARDPGVEIVYPVHLNPNVRDAAQKILRGTRNIHLTEPLDYPHLIWLMDKSTVILTDSGGIQEEAPSLGKPLLVLRDVTERTEGIKAGTAVLVGTDREKIVSRARALLSGGALYKKMSKAKNPYGDGHACERIEKALAEYFKGRDGAEDAQG